MRISSNNAIFVWKLVSFWADVYQLTGTTGILELSYMFSACLTITEAEFSIVCALRENEIPPRLMYKTKLHNISNIIFLLFMIWNIRKLQ